MNLHDFDENAKPCRICGRVLFTKKLKPLCGMCEENVRLDRNLGWLVLITLAIFAVLAVRMNAAPITEAFLDQIAVKESGGNPNAIGKAGEVGLFQMKPIAVSDVCRVYGWSKWQFKDNQRAFARAFLLITQKRMERAGYEATQFQLYRAYNLGFSRWKRTTKGNGVPATLTTTRPSPPIPGRESTERLVAVPRRSASQQATGPGVLSH